ncbi:snapalysin family zinc-dependent metalloprotease [Amycolatopsis sp. cg5]|uniref:snapalysin family zinc-dependent metalloprotease n=1 Tax=Amycolatopsis sp. cg5 TaxID=3238802 RepID=UPI0035249DB6
MSRTKFVMGAVALAAAVLPLTAGMASAAPTATVVYYNASGAPSFQSAIASGAANWNRAVSNVQLRSRTSGASLRYTEGNDPRGSYAQTNGHGSGTIFIDYTQARQYDVVRIAAHETGHALGLPDHYSGPCSELMSGGGPGTSCHNANPNATEAARVQRLWANGLTANDAGTRTIVETVYAK